MWAQDSRPLSERTLLFFILSCDLPSKGNLQARSVGGTWLQASFSWGGRENVERGEADVPYLSFERAHEAGEEMEPTGIKIGFTSHTYHSRVPPEGNWACRRVRRHVLNTHVRGWVLFGMLFLFVSSRSSGRCTRPKDETGWCCRAATAAIIPSARPCKQL